MVYQRESIRERRWGWRRHTREVESLDRLSYLASTGKNSSSQKGRKDREGAKTVIPEEISSVGESTTRGPSFSQ